MIREIKKFLKSPKLFWSFNVRRRRNKIKANTTRSPRRHLLFFVVYVDVHISAATQASYYKLLCPYNHVVPIDCA